jgi:hypothetical protein
VSNDSISVLGIGPWEAIKRRETMGLKIILEIIQISDQILPFTYPLHCDRDADAILKCSSSPSVLGHRVSFEINNSFVQEFRNASALMTLKGHYLCCYSTALCSK